MSFRSSTSSFRRSLGLGALILAAFSVAVDRSSLPATSFYGGAKLAEKEVGLERLERRGKVDVIAVGSSLVDLGFDAARFTELTGKTAYNLGVSGTDSYQQALFIRRVVVPHHRPETIFWAMRDAPRTTSVINRQYLEAPALRHSEWPLGGLVFELERRLPHFRKTRLIDWFVEPEGRRAADTLDEHGMTITATLQRPPPEGRPGEGHRMEEEHAVSLAEARAAFAETLDYCEREGVRVIFFLTPYLASTYRRQSGYSRDLLTGAFADHQTWLTETLAERGVPLVNLRFSAEISPDPELFFDSKHVNRLGARPLAGVLARVYETGEVPARWRDLPSQAELEAILGSIDESALPALRIGEPVPVRDLASVIVPRLGRASVHARFTVEEAGSYGLVVFDDQPRQAGSFFVRLGEGWYELAQLPASAGDGRAVPFPPAFALEPGEHRLEIHSRGKAPIDWARLAVMRSAP